VEKDRMDKSAMGHDFIAKVEKHGSQVDAAKGFGGKFGVTDQKDKSALGWDHLEKVEKHTSSKGNKVLFLYCLYNSPVNTLSIPFHVPIRL
jgi:cortactin